MQESEHKVLKKKKIIFFMANLHAGGAERVTTNIIRQVDKEQFDITLLIVSKEGEYLNDIPSYVDIVNLDIKRVLFSIFKLRKFLQKINADILYSTSYHTSIAIYLALKGIKNRPYILSRNPISPKLLIEQVGLSFIWRVLLEKAYRSSDRVIAQTPEMRDEIIQYYGVNSKNVDVFINPLDSDNIDKKIENITNPFDKKRINVVAAGRLAEQKDFDVLLYAFKNVVKENSSFVLHIIGRDDGEEENLKSLCKKLNLQNSVKFWGFQKNPYRFFYFSDLFVLSSKREGLPNAVLENLYLKKPIVATDCIPFMSELITDKKNGFIVDVGDIDALGNAIINYNKLNTSEEMIKSSSVKELFRAIIEQKEERK